jgi:hypothetical protein
MTRSTGSAATTNTTTQTGPASNLAVCARTQPAAALAESDRTVGPDSPRVELDVFGQIGQGVAGPDGTFPTVLAELMLSGKNLRHARRRAAQALRDPPRILPA